MALSFSTQRSVPQRTPISFAPRVRRVREVAPLHHVRCFSEVSAQGGPGPDEDAAQVAARLNQMLRPATITGQELRDMVVEKWGRTYDVRLNRQNSRMYLQVMWKFLEQKSFPLSEEQFMQQLDAVAEYITEWGVAATVRHGIANANPRGPGYTGGTSARCISIPLDVDLSGARRGEWS
ncbi:hypothetical protein V8C86DRAFT_2563486 [Haematococcus lacustris]